MGHFFPINTQVERRLAKASKDKKTDPNEVSALNKVKQEVV
jgi:hypothetical protein